MEELEILLSASQMGTSEQCERRWGFVYLDGIRSPGTPAQELGTEVHAVAEDWLTNSTPPPTTKAGDIMRQGIHLLPSPGAHLLVEHEFRFKDGPLVWRGFIDFIDPTSRPIKVGDHKTTKNLRYAKTPKQLSEDTQGIIYAKEAMRKFGVHEVELEWIYYPTVGKVGAKKVSVMVGKEHVDRIYRTLRVRGISLLDHKRNADSGVELQVEKFPHPGCRAYGGCTFLGVCEQLNKGNDVSDLLERLKRMSENGKTKGAVAVPVPVLINPPVEEETVRCDDAVEIEVPTPKRGRPKKHRAIEIAEEAAAAEAAEKAEAFKAKPVKGSLPERIPPQKGRRKKKKTKSEEQDEQIKELVEARKAAGANDDPVSALTLYVDCMPSKSLQRTVDIQNIIMECAAQAATEHGVDHYRMIEFGKGPAQLCVCLERYFSDIDNVTGHVVLCTSNQIQADSIPYFEAMADVVVRAIK